MARLPIIPTVALVTLLAGVIGCSSPAPAPPPAPAPLTDADVVNSYQRCWALWNGHTFAEFRKCYGAGAMSSQSGYGKAMAMGPDDIVQASESLAAAFPDITGEGQLILVNGTNVAGVFLLKGTNTGPLKGPDGTSTPATGKPIGLMIGHTVELDKASLTVVTEAAAVDSATLAAQLGLSRSPARKLVAHMADAPAIVVAKHDELEAKNVALEKAQTADWNAHNPANFSTYFSTSLVFHDYTSPADQNAAQAEEMTSALWKGFSDIKITYTSIWGAGDYVATVGTLAGTNNGVFAPMKLARTGRKLAEPFVEIDRLAGGVIAEVWLFYDSAMMAMQMGVK